MSASNDDRWFCLSGDYPPSFCSLLCLKGTPLGSNVGLLRNHLCDVMDLYFVSSVVGENCGRDWNCSNDMRTRWQDDSLYCLNQGLFWVFII